MTDFDRSKPVAGFVRFMRPGDEVYANQFMASVIRFAQAVKSGDPDALSVYAKYPAPEVIDRYAKRSVTDLCRITNRAA